MSPDLEHCLAKLAEIAARGDGARRSAFQLGYNLGRVAELAGMGRESCWDRWKDPATTWDRPALERLARELQAEVEARNRLDP